jgi:uncharacterized protein (DUF1778 family)
MVARATFRQKGLLQRVARLTGRSMSDFVISSTIAVVQETTRVHEVTQSTACHTKKPVEAFVKPGGSSEAMVGRARRCTGLVDRL